MLWLILIWLLIFLHLFFKRHYNYWFNRNIQGPKPLYLVGNVGSNLIKRKALLEIYDEVYKEFQNEPVVGMFRGWSPFLLIRDPDLVKRIMITDFKHFSNNDFNVDKETDILFGRNPFVLKDEEWKTTRAQLTPTLTMSKVKQMLPMFNKASSNFIEYLKKNHKKGPLEIRNLCGSYTIDNVGSCCFGVESNSFETPNSDLRRMAKAFIEVNSWQAMITNLFLVFPSLAMLFKFKIIPTTVERKLLEIITGNLDYRRKNNLQINDFLNTVSQLKMTVPNFSDIDVTAHAATFFFDGYETSSWVFAYLLYFLAQNPEEQTILRDEVTSVLDQHNGILTPEALQEMVFLDACVEESNRLIPGVPHLSKVCTKDFTFRAKNSKKEIKILKDTLCVIPTTSLHLDEAYFPEATKFNPNRFLGDNREMIPKHLLLSFGQGPRMCLGKNFGFLQVKAGCAEIIKNFKLQVNNKTSKPLIPEPWYFINAIKGGLWLDFIPINNMT